MHKLDSKVKEQRIKSVIIKGFHISVSIPDITEHAWSLSVPLLPRDPTALWVTIINLINGILVNNPNYCKAPETR